MNTGQLTSKNTTIPDLTGAVVLERREEVESRKEQRENRELAPLPALPWVDPCPQGSPRRAASRRGFPVSFHRVAQPGPPPLLSF